MRSTRSVPLPYAGHGAFRRIVKRNLSAILGLGVLALAAATAASLATWTANDPSLSHATDHAARNVLGFPGAVVSDLFTQFLGLAAMLVLLAPVTWAWRLVFAQPSRASWPTAITWVLGVATASLALALLPVPHSWPLPIGLGGVAGDLMLKLPSLALGHQATGLMATGLLIVLAAATLLLTIHACGLSLWRWSAPDEVEAEEDVRPVPTTRRVIVDTMDDEEAEEDEDDVEERPKRLVVALGAVTHIGLSAAATTRRILFRRASRAPLALRRVMLPSSFEEDAYDDLYERREPSLDMADDAAFDDEEAWDEDLVEEAPPPPPKKKRKVEPPAPKPKVSRRAAREAQASLLESDEFDLPPLDLLSEAPAADKKAAVSQATLEQNARLLEGVLDDFGVRGEIINVRPGPVVTLYELEPAPGIKSARVIGLADDIARSMSAISCRVAVIPGKNAIGIELPNSRREMVYLRELLASEDFEKTKSRLALCLGKTIGGEPVIADLSRMPHLLVAGTTGSGKSVSVNTMILSLLYRMTPEECRMIMIDPKMLELSTYDGIPHLMTPVVTDPKQAVVALKWTVREMEDRYRKMSKLGVRNIDGYNTRLAQARKKGEILTRTIQTGFDRDTGEPTYEQEELSLDPMPFIVVIIDEMADLMMVAGKDIEGAVQRLAQMARAAGIHVVMATQRPSVDVITGTIKANFPTRISFQVTSKIDSRTILGEQGAEQLLGQGDMLFMAGGGRIQRVHGPFVSDQEVDEVVAHLKSQAAPKYLEAITADEDADGGGPGDALAGGGGESNDLYDRAVAIVLRDRKVSTSYIQRRLSIGYNRAASIIERMENEGVVGPANHAGKRDILVPEEDEGGFR